MNKLKFSYKIIFTGESKFPGKNNYLFTISEQDSRIRRLDEEGRVFKTSKNWIIKIASTPEINRGCKRIFILGSSKKITSYPFSTTENNVAEIVEALEEFKKSFCHQDAPNHKLTTIFA